MSWTWEHRCSAAGCASARALIGPTTIKAKNRVASACIHAGARSSDTGLAPLGCSCSAQRAVVMCRLEPMRSGCCTRAEWKAECDPGRASNGRRACHLGPRPSAQHRNVIGPAHLAPTDSPHQATSIGCCHARARCNWSPPAYRAGFSSGRMRIPAPKAALCSGYLGRLD